MFQRQAASQYQRLRWVIRIQEPMFDRSDSQVKNYLYITNLVK
jgi:hypothetical protein